MGWVTSSPDVIWTIRTSGNGMRGMRLEAWGSLSHREDGDVSQEETQQTEEQEGPELQAPGAMRPVRSGGCLSRG